MLAAVATPWTRLSVLRIAPPPIKPIAGDQALNDAGLRIRDHVGGGRGEKHVAAAGHGDQGKGANADAVGLFFAVPAYRENDDVGNQQTDDVFRSQ